VAAATNAALRDLGEQSFDEVQPTRACRREVDVITRVSCQPCSHLFHLVRTVVVQHQVDVQATGEVRIDVIEKPQKLLMPVLPVTIADVDSAGHIQRREQGRHAMPLVIMALPRRYAGRQRENRLRAVQGLDLALLIHTQHDRVVRRMHIQPYDVPNLFHKLRIFGKLEIFVQYPVDVAYFL